MNPNPIPKARPLRLQTPWAISCGLALILMAPAHAQSATNFNTGKLAPKATAIKVVPNKKINPATPAPKDAGPVSASPSRYVGEADLAAYVEALSAVLSMKARTTDPFGQLQDPDAKPVVKVALAKSSNRVAPAQAIPLSDIVRLIQVTTIMPKEKCFLVGTRSIKQGDSIPITFRGKTIRVEVSAVSSREIGFRNLENGETASRKLNLLPAGMTPGTHGIAAPGMLPDRPDSPLNLDYGSETSQNP